MDATAIVVEFRPGDVVQMGGDGPRMTVVGRPQEYGGATYLRCVRMTDAGMIEHAITPDLLRLVESSPAG